MITLLRSSPVRKYHSIYLCSCGKEFEASYSKIKSGHTTSCGCARVKNMTTHGLSSSPEYTAWCKMKERCYDINNIHYKNYGGRGITVCDRWRESFENFIQDMGNKPTPSHSLDRVKVNEGYEPTNCKWSTTAEQALNKTNNKLVTYNGETKPLKVLVDELGLEYNVVWKRLKRGWPIYKAFMKR